jgi:hypothetical protein
VLFLEALRECGATGAVLGCDDLVASKLDALNESLEVLLRDVPERRLRLAEKGDDSDARVSTNDRDLELAGRSRVSDDFCGEGLCADDVERGYAKDALRVVDAGLLEHLGDDGDSRVDWVRDDADESLWAKFGDGSREVTNNPGIDLRSENKIAGRVRKRNSEKGEPFRSK